MVSFLSLKMYNMHRQSGAFQPTQVTTPTETEILTTG